MNILKTLRNLKHPIVKSFGFLLFKKITLSGLSYPVSLSYAYHEESVIHFKLSLSDLDTERIEEASMLLLEQYLNYLVKTCKYGNKYFIYTKNLSLDGVYLIKVLTKLTESNNSNVEFKTFFIGNELLTLEVYFTQTNPITGIDTTFSITFYSLYKLLSFSLTNLVKGLLNIKLENNNIINNIDLKDSNVDFKLKYELLLYYNSIKSFQKTIFDAFKLDILKYPSISSLALGVYRTHYYSDKNAPIEVLDGNLYQRIRKSYYGGHCSNYKPIFKSKNSDDKLYHYDVVSLYPSMMLKEMPVGKPTYVEFKSDDVIKDDMFGFITAEITCPDNIRRPVLPKRMEDDSLLYPTGKWVGMYFIDELRHYSKFGYKYKLLNGFLYNKNSKDSVNKPFKEFVTTLYNMRKEAKLNNNYVMDFTTKLLLNSLYGRLGFNPFKNQKQLINFSDLDNYIKNYEVIDIELEHLESLNKAFVTYFDPESVGGILNVACASAIAAYARIHLSDYLVDEKYDVYYTDTDSLFLTSQLPNKIVGNDLGLFKLEGIIQEACFVAPKVYFVDYFTDGNITKQVVKSKGSGVLTKEEILKAYDSGKFSPVNSEIVLKQWGSLKINTVVRNFTRCVEQTKRLHVYDDHGNWVNTKPIHINLL